MRARHRRPHSGPARHLNPPFGVAKRRHGGRLHVRAEGHETKPRVDRPRKRQAGGSLSSLTPAQLQALSSAGQQPPGISSANANQALTEQALSGQKRGGRVRIKRKRGGRAQGGAASQSGGSSPDKGQQGSDYDDFPSPEEARGRKDGGKADGHWMEKAFANSHGQFKAKAKRAGKSVAAEAAAVTKPGSHASTKTKRQANLAKLGAKYGGK